MFFALFTDRGDWLGDHDTLDEAIKALDEMIADDPSAAAEVAIFPFDDQGGRVGEPITRTAAA